MTNPVASFPEEPAWTQHGKVRAREADGVLEVVVDGLTTQAKYYKPLIYEFFRKAWRGARPAWGEYAVEIRMDYVGDPPWLDLDNLAKAILDAIKGYAFHDDAQVARLLVERASGERERITVRVRKISDTALSPLSRPSEVRS
ncbi:RusA family crossover junction endodeoxyribonuclease [Phenylobacterium sp.]|uniref:RusA family crossover junction endodeoxyribonuclease n=1 Tax=Phenylobacterium sp. TaxID=1871053 RepID=UPI0011F70B87|nr:RusA family crossover junction endodeoxyribonuclease [Phenylobacterium sp.]THD64042.1 MAG: RusA family crossover junction endodeoxyribonuclease [Phenylobacterium sp.]